MDMYTLICIKWITNKNLLYKKINKIKFKNSKKTTNNNSGCSLSPRHQPSPGVRVSGIEGRELFVLACLSLSLSLSCFFL